jgi:hypothetical protein
MAANKIFDCTVKLKAEKQTLIHSRAVAGYYKNKNDCMPWA